MEENLRRTRGICGFKGEMWRTFMLDTSGYGARCRPGHKRQDKGGASLLNQAVSAVFVFIQNAAGYYLISLFSVTVGLYSCVPKTRGVSETLSISKQGFSVSGR